MTKVPVIKFMFRSEWKVLADAIQISPAFESEEFNSANDLVTFLSGNDAGMIVAALRDKNDLVQLATLMKLVKKIAANTFVKVIVVNFSGNKQFESAVAKLGILDLVDEKIQTKALRFKIDFMMKSINAQAKKNANVAANNVKSLENGKKQEAKAAELAPIMAEPLECENDIWLLRSEADCKKVLTRWLVKLMGPSPYVANWVDSGTPGIWKFEFKPTTENVFIFGNGFWFFRGDQKPDFVWSENIWSFTGNSFDLFYKEGNDIFSRLKLKDKQLTLAKTSEYAKTKERSIIESFDKDLVFKKQLQGNSEKESFDKEQEQYKNLDGKGKTETLNQGPLSGKGKTSNIDSSPLSMDLKPGENTTANDPLSQKASNSNSSSYWKGKNEYEKEAKGDLAAPTDQATKTGAELSLENKGNHEKYYKNHNEAEKFEAKDIGHSIKKDGVSDNLRGKTDPTKSSSAAGGNNLDGKSSTDQLEGHLTSPNARKENVPNEKSPSELTGKSSTDKIAGHLTSANAKDKQTEEAEQNKKKNESNSSAKENRPESLNGNKNAKESNESAGVEKPVAEHGSGQKELAGTKERASERKNAGPGDNASESAATKAKTAASASANASPGSKSKDSAPENAKDKEKTVAEIEAKPKSSSAADLSEHLAALKAKKEKLEKARAENSKAENAGFETADDNFQEPKKDIHSTNKSAGRTSEGGTDKISSIYSSKVKPKEAKASNQEEEVGKVLPFSEKEKKKDVVSNEPESKELEDATQTAKVTSSLVQDSVKFQANLDDFFDETIIFSTKDLGITSSKQISLNLNFNYMNKDTNLKLSGNVMQVESDGEGSQYVTVEISKESARAFDSFMKVYNTRQKNIDVFFKAVKGY